MINRGRQDERFLATILFTDIVGSTDLAAEVGDKEWRRLIAAHHSRIRTQLKKFGGREVDTAGDGFLCSFDQPAQAVRAADAILAEVAPLGLTLRAGIHTGEAERIGGGKLGGIAVHIAARIMAMAAGGQVLVSSTVRDLVAGSRLGFTDAGTHELKGVPGEWHLYELVREVPAAIEATLPAAESTPATGLSRQTKALAIFGIVFGIAVLVVAGVLAVMVLGRPATVVAEPGPNSVVTIDAASAKVLDVHAVQAGPVALAIDPVAHRLWVASLDAGVVTDFGIGGAQSADRTTGRVGRPTDVAIGEGVAWIANAFDKTVTMLDLATGQARSTVPDVMARQIAYGAGSAWATDDLADRLLRLDRQSGQVAQIVELGAGAYPSGVVVAANAVWVGNEGLSTVARVDATNASIVASGIATRAVPGAMATSTDAVWIAGREADVVLRIDPVSNSGSETIAVCDQPVSIAVEGSIVWVGCAGEQEVWRLGADGESTAKIDVGGVPSDLAVADGRVYVTVRQQ